MLLIDKNKISTYLDAVVGRIVPSIGFFSRDAVGTAKQLIALLAGLNEVTDIAPRRNARPMRRFADVSFRPRSSGRETHRVAYTEESFEPCVSYEANSITND
jgi:hypothetical protein